MVPIRVARRYAKALLATALQDNNADTVERDLDHVIAQVAASSDLRMLLRSPVIEASRKKSIFAEIFGSALSPITLQFLNLLAEKGREDLIIDVTNQFRLLFDRHRSILRVTVTSAVDLDQTARDRVVATLAHRTGKTILATYAVDPTLLGGVSVRIGDTILDSTLRHHLDRLRTSLTSGGASSNN